MREACRTVWISLQGVCTIVAIVFLAAIPILAQQSTSTISGTVKDASGGVVPETRVTIQNTETSLTRTVTSGDDAGRRKAGVLASRARAMRSCV